MIGQLQKKIRRLMSMAALNAALFLMSIITEKSSTQKSYLNCISLLKACGVIRKFFNSIVISLLMLIMNFSYAWAQVSLKDISVNYTELRLDKGYSIIYDNPNAAAKLNEFKIKFYKDATFIDETRVETFPPNGTIVTYGLTNSVIGFNKAELSIISLHSGNIIDFPLSAASIIALIEPTEVKPTDSASTPAEPVNRPPLAKNTFFELGATVDTFTRSITDEYSDPDGDILTVIETSKAAPPLSYQLSNNGTLTLTAPSVTGTYTIPYEVQDPQGASASADINVAVVFPNAAASSLTQHIEAVEQLLSQIGDKKTETSNLPTMSQALIKRREDLLADSKSLESKASERKLLPLKTDIAELTTALELSKNATSVDELLNSLGDLNTESLDLQAQLQSLQSQSLEEGLDISNFKAELTSLAENLDILKNKENTLVVSSPLTLAQMEKWESQYQILKQKIPSPPLKWLPIALVVLALGALILWTLKKPLKPSPDAQTHPKKGDEKNNKKRPLMSFPVYVVSREGSGFTTKLKTYPDDMRDFNSDKGDFDISTSPGLIFPKNSSFQVIDKSVEKALPMSWEAAYDATGRIGLRQEGIPTVKDKSLGTGVLIHADYIMTNRHVFDKIVKRLRDKKDPVGIEFHAEMGSDKTDFYKISSAGNDYYIFDERDAVILKLETPVDTSRRPAVTFSDNPPKPYSRDTIMVIGYPQKPRKISDLTREEREFFENIKLFDVKLVSEGDVFLHKDYDPDEDYLVETSTSGKYADNELQPAMCHRASTLRGNSGSPVVSKETGDVIGLHFGEGVFFSAQGDVEMGATNVAHSGQILAGFVTHVTSSDDRNMVAKNYSTNRETL